MEYEVIFDGGFKVRFKEGTKWIARAVASRAIANGRWSGLVNGKTREYIVKDLYLTKPEALICMAFGLDYNSIKEYQVEAE